MRFCYGIFSNAGGRQTRMSFTGTIHNLIVDVSGDLIDDGEARVRRIMAQQ